MPRLLAALAVVAAAGAAPCALAGPVPASTTRPGDVGDSIGDRRAPAVPASVTVGRRWTLADAVSGAPDTVGGQGPAARRPFESRGAYACSDACCPQPACPCDPWKFRAVIPLWIPGVTGTFAVGDTSVQSNGDFFGRVLNRFVDVATSIEFAFMGRFEVLHGRWSLALDGFGARVGNTLSVEALGAEADATLHAFVGRAMLGYRVLDRSLGCDPCCPPHVAADVFVGVRDYRVSLDLKTASSQADAVHDWLDPIVGARAEWELSRRWRVGVEGDVGGFGVGSDLSWYLSGWVGYQFTPCFSMRFGWSILDVDYSTGSGARRFQFNAEFSGPTISFAFDF